MKLMLLTEYYPPDVTAAGIRMNEFVKVFSEQKYLDTRVIVSSTIYKSNYFRLYSMCSDNVDIVRYGRKYLPHFLLSSISPFALIFWLVLLIKEIRDFKPDILVTTAPSYIPSIAIYFLSKIFGKPFCIDIRDEWINSSIIDFNIQLYPFYLKYPSKFMYIILHYLFICSCKNAILLSLVYDAMRKELLECTDFKIPIVTIPNGINFSELEQIEKGFDRNRVLTSNHIAFSPSTRIVIFVGVVGVYYKPEVLINHLRKLIKYDKMDINYLIVGGGDKKETIKNLAKEMMIDDNVFVLGKRAHSETIELILASDVAFYPLDETYPSPDCALGVKILEYIACKLPILSIASDRSIVSQLVTDYKIGISLRWDEEDRLGNVLKKILYNKEYLDNIEKSYNFFIHEFDRRKNGERLFLKISELLQRRNK